MPKTRQEWIDWFEDDLTWKEQGNVVGDMGEQVDILHALTEYILECAETNEDPSMRKLLDIRFGDG
jgi:hypothetical protein